VVTSPLLFPLNDISRGVYMVNVIRGAAFRRPIVFVSTLVTFSLVAILGVATAYAVCVPTVYSVTGSAPPASGNWTSTSGVWTPSGGFPGCAPGDSASDTNVSPTTLIVNSLIPNPIISLNINCNGCAIVIQSGGQLALAGPGTIGNGSTIQVQPGGILTLASGGSLTMQTGSTFDLSGGIVDVQTGGTLTLQSSSSVTSSGTLQLSGGTLSIDPAATLNLGPGSTVPVTAGGTIGGGGKITGSGLVDVQNGTLDLHDGTGDIPFNIASGATANSTSGTYTLTTNGVVSGAGTLGVAGGTLSIGGVTSPGGFSMTAGTLTGAGFLSTNNFTWSGGTITGSGGTQLNGSGNGSIDGATGAMTLDGRTFNDYGYITFSATANPLVLDNNALFAVYGTMVIGSDGTISQGGGGTNLFSVAPNGLLWKVGSGGTATISAPFANSATTISSQGELMISGDGTSTGGFFVDNGAEIAFAASSTILQGSVFGGGTVSFPSGSTTFSGCCFSVEETEIYGGTLTMFASGDTNGFMFDAGTLGIGTNATFTLNVNGTWASGTINGSGTFDVAGTLTIDAANGNTLLSGVELKNDGTVNYTAGTPNELMTANALITNNGLFDIQTDQPIAESVIIIGDAKAPPPPHKKGHSDGAIVTGSSIQNNGTFQKSSGSGTTNVDPAFSNDGTMNAASGTLDFTTSYNQSSGTTTLGPGNITVATTMQLSGGELNGMGTVTGNVQNDATVAPGTGLTTCTITVTGNYTQGSGGKLAIDLSGPSAFDALAVGGSTTLDGTLDVALINSYQPANGATFPVHTFATRSGDFSVKNLPTYGAFGSITSNYQPTELDLIAVVAPNADVQITKTGPAGVVAGQNIVYTVTVTNNGPSTAAGVVVADPTPANLTFVSNGGDCTGAYPCNLGSLTSGQTMVINSTYSTSPSFSGNVTNTATVSSTTADPNAGNNSSSIVTNVGAQADLAVSKNGPATANPGQNVTYTVTVTNNGPSPATGVVVTDPTPAGLAFVSNTGSCATPYPCSVGALAAGQTATIMSTYTIPSNFAGASTTNTASATSAVNDPNNTDNSASATTTVVQQADLAISKNGPPSASPGQLVSYTVTVTNLGPSTASAIVVTDPTPAGLTFVSNTGACTTAYPCNLAAPLPAGQTATITTTYSVPANYAGTSITNTASVSAASSDSNPSNNSASVTTPVAASADLSINKSGPASFTTGTNISYTIAVTNNGPLSAANVFVTDPTPSGLTFISNSGACTTPFPCALGTLTSGQTSTIIATFNVPSGYPGASISNTATVSSSTNDGNGANNASTATTPIASGSSIDLSVVKSGPAQTNPSNTVTFQIFVMNGSALAATNVNVVDPTPSGLVFVANAGACTTPFPCTIASIAPHSSVTIQATYFVQSTGGNITNTASVSSAATDPQPSNNSSSFTISVTPPPQCPAGGPTLLSPANASVVVSPVSLVWTAVDNATLYLVTINGGGGIPKQITTGTTSALVTLPNGNYTWTVEAIGDAGCDPQSSAVGTFSICTPPSGAPTPAIPGQMTTGQNYTLEWTPVDGAATYEVQESPDSTFTSVTTFTTVSQQQQFSKQVTAPTAFFYRVRAIASCNFQGPFSQFVAIVVVPVPAPNVVSPSVNVPVGSTKPVTWQIHIPGLPGITTSYVATTDKPWISIVPVSGIIGPDGVNLTISLNPSDLQNGTWTGTILVVYGTSSVSSKVHTDASTPPTTSIPVSVNVVTPVSPQPLTGASSTALVVPSLGFLASAGSTWRSDIRLANLGAQIQKYQLSFNNGSGSMKQTFINIDAGATTALDDFVRTWLGVGPLGDSANGALTIQALDTSGKPVANNLNTVVSSRTFNAVGASTLGQFIAATPFASFIGRSTPSAPSILSLQQIAQSDLFRTNLGLVEAANKSASVIVSVFNGAGSKLLDLPMSLKAGEQKQLNSFLLQNGITLSNGHVEVQVTSGDGKVTAYASVIDSSSSDPFFVTGVPLGASNANRFVVPGVAEINSASANWRSDLRVLNGGNAPQTATITFYPSSDAANNVSQVITINPGEVKALDNVLQSAFGLTDTGGVLHVTTNNNAPLVVTARTYDQTPGGSVGQFIPAITPADSVGSGGRALQILQLEESPRYRTNIGLAEVNGKPATAEISVVLPDSKVSPVVQVPLGAFEFVQLPVLSSLGIGNVYNTRISVRVIGGDGKVTAYGSVIDRNTSDATYVPAQ
jgi:uncharacterized repeat protein (TIGR01451 family)